MNEVRRCRVKSEINVLTDSRARIRKIMSDEDRALEGVSMHGHGSREATDSLSETSFILLVAIGMLEKALKC